MTAAEKIQKMVEMGGKEWTKDTLHRVYFNSEFMMNTIGLKYDTYKTGNISSATLNGEWISNSQARKVLASISGKLWYDATDEKFYTKGVESDVAKTIVDTIKAQLN